MSHLVLVEELKIVLQAIQEVNDRFGQLNKEAITLQNTLAELQATKARIEVDLTTTRLEVM